MEPSRDDRKRLTVIWQHMKSRCLNPANPAFDRYGGRGITICSEWAGHSSAPFMKWALENGYSPELSIDRIDNDKGYCPENCRWATRYIQNTNTKIKPRYARGVCRKSDGRFIARLVVNGIRKTLGSFATPEEAYAVYRNSVIKHHGVDPNNF